LTPPFSPRPPDPVDTASFIRRCGLGRVDVLAETGSTMDRAREVAGDPACQLPAVVVADVQTRGRGRRGAEWWQPPGSLAASIVIDGGPGSGLWGGPRPTWSLACGVAVAEALRELEPGIAAVVRWPNDVEVDGRKLAGILVETTAAGRAIFGIGVNTTGSVRDAPAGIAHRVATVPDLTGRTLSRQRLLESILPRLTGLLATIDTDPPALVERYRPLCGLAGTFVRVYAGADVRAGICRGITADGGLVVDTPAGRVAILSGSLTAPGGEWRGDADG